MLRLQISQAGQQLHNEDVNTTRQATSALKRYFPEGACISGKWTTRKDTGIKFKTVYAGGRIHLIELV